MFLRPGTGALRRLLQSAIAIALLLVLLWPALVVGLAAEEPPSQKRFSEAEFLRRLREIDACESQLKRLSTRADAYFATKAAVWLDFARGKLTDNDHGPVIDAAFGEATNLVQQLEAARADIPRDTVLFPFAAKVRDDLWQLAADLKKATNFAVGQTHIARLEVYLVWAGYEYKKIGWRRAAKPTLEKAEGAAAAAQASMGYKSQLAPGGVPSSRGLASTKGTLNLDVLQDDLRTLNARGFSLRSYAFAKAQHWLDFARAQDEAKNRTGIVADAAREAARIIRQIEAGDPKAGFETPTFKRVTRVREDLWQLTEQAKREPAFATVPDLVAQLEVQLVWAGHEHAELGWRTAKPHLAMAERLAKDIAECIAAPTSLPTSPAQ
jgi:hypothetical protein